MMRCRAIAVVLAVACVWSSAAASEALAASGSSDARGAAAQTPDTGDAAFNGRTRAAIKSVLAEREFADLNAAPSAWWHRLYDKFLSLLTRVASWIGKLPGWLVWVIVVWMVVTLLAILVHLTYTFVTMLGGISRSSPSTERREHPSQLLGLLPLEFDAMYAEAQRLLHAGDWLAATKHFYVAAILWLDRQGCIVFRLSKTDRDYIDELRTHGGIQAGFRRLTGCFEPITYGGRPATSSTTQDMAEGVEVLLHESAGSVTS
jgi:hypothetical protein